MTNHTWSLRSRRVLVPAGIAGIVILASLTGVLWQNMSLSPPPVQALAGAIIYAVTARPLDQLEPTPTATPIPTQTPARSAVYARIMITPAMADGQALPPSATPTNPPPAPAPLPPTATRPAPMPAPVAAAVPQPAAEPPARIVAPSIHLDARVVEMGWKIKTRNGQKVSEWVVPSNAAGWHINSALPGRPGNTVLSGHNNVEGEVFRYVSDLEIGDKITLYAGGKTYTYTVREKHLLREAGAPASERRKNAQWIDRTDDVRLTLVTCWPYRWPGNTHRMIVVARP